MSGPQCRGCERPLQGAHEPSWKRCDVCQGAEAAAVADVDARLEMIRKRLHDEVPTYDDVALGVDPAFEKLREAVDHLDDVVYNLVGLRSCPQCRRASRMEWNESLRMFVCMGCGPD